MIGTGFVAITPNLPKDISIVIDDYSETKQIELTGRATITLIQVTE
jgi:hypothetical protein